MTPIDLVDELVKFIKDVVKDYDFTTKKKGVLKAPSVYPGYLPSKEDDDDTLTPNDYPFVIVRFLSESDDQELNDTVDIRILIGTYSEDEQNGWRDPVNMATRIKLHLKKKPIIGPFSLTDKIQIELFEEQLKPFWHLIMDLSFNIPKVQPDWSEMFNE
jgi:hypothetical protein